MITAYLLDSGTLAAQSIQKLRQKYGDPVSEEFIVRPGIKVIATFGTDGRIREFLVAPQNTALIKSQGMTLPIADVNAVVDELAPPSLRGKHLVSEFINADCLPANDCNGSTDNFEKVKIYYNAARDGQVHYAVIQLKE